MLGYHGCDAAVARRLLNGSAFRKSQNDYDWLGHGIYFWEANPRRGLQWARRLAKKPGSKIKKPDVIGAVIDLRQCLDLTTTAGIEQVRIAYGRLAAMTEVAGAPLPKNSADLLARRLDCAVINTLHDARAVEGLNPIDTVRGVFIEGEEAFPSSGFMTQTHVQICVCNSDCIRGVFRVPRSDLA